MHNTEHKFHFIAIGGIGMSGLAKCLLEKGYEVSGSDLEDSKYLVDLKKLGAKIYIGHDTKNLPEGQNVIVVISTAISQDNVELVEAKKRNYKIFHRSDLLQYISQKFSESENCCFIGFSGTHGKTTTSGLCAYILEKIGKKPSFSVGGIVPELKTNAKYNKNDFFVAELDESDGTIVKYQPNITVINNLEADHHDFYKNGLETLVKTFSEYLNCLKPKSVVVFNRDCENLKNFINSYINKNSLKFIDFSTLQMAKYEARTISVKGIFPTFKVFKEGILQGEISLQIPGMHNVYNALAVCAVLLEIGLDFNEIKEHFSSFKGMGRRFQKVADFRQIEIIDDYAHHPTEIISTLNAVENINKKIVAIFQPHRFTRLKGLWNEFTDCFLNAKISTLFVTDVYCASEEPIEGINSENFVKNLVEKGFKGDVFYVDGTIEQAAKKIHPKLEENSIVFTFGAGDITKMGKSLESLENSQIKK